MLVETRAGTLGRRPDGALRRPSLLRIDALDGGVAVRVRRVDVDLLLGLVALVVAARLLLARLLFRLGQRVTLVGTSTLAGSVIALDDAVRNLVNAGIALPTAVAAASRNPLAMLGVTDRGRIAVGQRADLVELDDGIRVLRVMRGGSWLDGA